MAATRRSLLVLSLLSLDFACAVRVRDGCTATSTWEDGTVIQRDCIIEGEGKASKASSNKGDRTISSEMKWLKDTRWNWNNWREVIFRSEGSFLAPAENCERQGNPNCRWWADDEKIYVNFGAAGLHTLTPDPDQQSLSGARDRDGDQVHATRVG